MVSISDINSKINKCYWNSSDVQLNLVVVLDFETIPHTQGVFYLGFFFFFYVLRSYFIYTFIESLVGSIFLSVDKKVCLWQILSDS